MDRLLEVAPSAAPAAAQDLHSNWVLSPLQEAEGEDTENDEVLCLQWMMSLCLEVKLLTGTTCVLK